MIVTDECHVVTDECHVMIAAHLLKFEEKKTRISYSHRNIRMHKTVLVGKEI